MSKVNHCSIVSQRNNFLQIIEELRYIRKRNDFLEEKVGCLQKEKLKLCNDVEELQSQLESSQLSYTELEKHLQEMRDFDEGSQPVEDLQKMKVALEASEKTIASLKNKIAGFNETKAVLEKKLSESEQKLAVNDKTSKLFSSKIDQFQATINKLDKQLEETTDVQIKLEQKISVGSSINKEVILVNEYQKCAISDLKKERLDLQNQIVALQGTLKLEASPVAIERRDEMTKLKAEIEKLRKENKNISQKDQYLEEERKVNAKLLKEAIDSSQHAHDMLNRNECQYRTQISELKNKIEISLSEIETLREKLLMKEEAQLPTDLNPPPLESGECTILPDLSADEQISITAESIVPLDVDADGGVIKVTEAALIQTSPTTASVDS